MTQSQIARIIAHMAHVGQVDKQGQPYIFHPQYVAATFTGVNDDAVAVAWLHDVLEDTLITARQLLAAGISEKNVSRVLMLTKYVSPNGKKDDYSRYIENIATKGDQITIMVKLADLNHNLRPGGEKNREKYLAAIARLEPLLHE